MRSRSLALLSLAVAALAACEPDFEPRSIVPGGTYVLASVDGQAPPVLVPGTETSEGALAIVAETLAVCGRGACQSQLTQWQQRVTAEGVPVGAATRTGGTYQFDGRDVCYSLCVGGRTRVPVTMDGSVLVVDWPGVGGQQTGRERRYRRVR